MDHLRQVQIGLGGDAPPVEADPARARGHVDQPLEQIARFRPAGPAPGGSTIFRATPEADAGASFIRRIDRLEEMLREQKAKRALEEVRRLVEAQGRLSQTGSAAELFRRILDEVGPALEADSAAVLKSTLARGSVNIWRRSASGAWLDSGRKRNRSIASARRRSTGCPMRAILRIAMTLIWPREPSR